MPRQIAKAGDVFWVPIEDETVVLGQIVEIQKEAMNSITCAFYNVRRDSPERVIERFHSPIAIQFVTKDLFTNGSWPRVGNEEIIVSENKLPHRDAQNNGWVGARIIGSGIIVKFLSAFFGLRSWNEMHDPNYYEELLLPGVRREENA